MNAPTADPFHTAELRRRVLAAWVDSPARFRADANAEDDYALDGYRGRLVVELAQNAADAARLAGQAGLLQLNLVGNELRAANTGAPLTAAGVESLSTLRASAKRDTPETPATTPTTDPTTGPATTPATTGRLGTGFAAVASIAEWVTIASRTGAVSWERQRAAAEVAERAHEAGAAGEPSALTAELDRWAGAVPLLRLPYSDATQPPQHYTTEVRIGLRAPTTGETPPHTQLADELAAVSPALLLALPDLAELRINVEGSVHSLHREPVGPTRVRTHVTTDSGTQVSEWMLSSATGSHDAATLAQRPREERDRPHWRVTWALPVDGDNRPAPWPDGVAHVVHAPTPSDTELRLPALLLGDFPLSADRRHVSPGTATDALLEAAAGTYTQLLEQLPTPSALDLVPEPLPGGGELDGRLRQRILDFLRKVSFLTSARNQALRPSEAVALPGGAEVAAVLADQLPTLLPGTWNDHPALNRLGIRRMTLAELADALPEATAPPEWWRRLYAALRTAGEQGTDLTDLGALPVPLADGRLVRGPKGVLLPHTGADTGPPAAQLSPLELRIADPAAVDSLLERLGAVPASPTALLTHPQTRAVVEHSMEAADPEPVAGCVLDLAWAADVTVATEPWLAELALRDTDGAYCPAGELMLPDSPLLGLLVPDAPFGVLASDIVARYGVESLLAVGVTQELSVFRAFDVPLDHVQALHELPLDGIEEWAEFVTQRFGSGEPALSVPELAGIRDLELIAPESWEQALKLLAAPEVRAAIVTPTRVHSPGGPVLDVPSPAAWWLGHNMHFDGYAPVQTRSHEADEPLRGLYPPAPARLDARLAEALGVRTTVAGLLAEPHGADELLLRLGDPRWTISRQGLEQVWLQLSQLSPDQVGPPEHTRAVWFDGSGAGAGLVVADAEEIVVVDAPDLLVLLAEQPVVLAPATHAPHLAEVLDLALASVEYRGAVTSSGQLRQVPDVIQTLLPEAPTDYLHHPALQVEGMTAAWRYVHGRIHADSPAGLARGLAWASGQWQHRHLIAEALRSPDSVAHLRDERTLDPE